MKYIISNSRKMLVAKPGTSSMALFLLMLLLPPPAARAQASSYPSPIIIYTSNLACQTEEPKQGTQVEDDGPCLLVCENSSETYSVNANPNSSYLWSVAGGTITGSNTGTDIVVEWGPSGHGSVSVTETLDGRQCTANLCADILSAPTALFTVPPSNEHSFCVKQEVVFLDASTVAAGAIVAWSWDFGDGSSSNEQNPTHSWNVPGTYIVRLTAYNECHCYGIFEHEVRIYSGTPVRISCPSVACEGQRASYTADIDCGGTWGAIGGQITSSSGNQAEVLWNAPSDLVDGFGIVTYSTAGCPGSCSQFATAKIPVICNNAAIKGETNACVGKQYRYSLPPWPATLFEWQVDNNAAAAIVDPKDKDICIDFLSPGTVTLSARYYNTMTHCSGTAQLLINVLPLTAIASSAPADEAVCQGSSATFVRMAGSTAIGSSWSVALPDGSTQSASGTSLAVTFSMPVTYVISASGGSYCAADPVTVKVLPKPAQPASIAGEAFVCPGRSYDYQVSPYNPSMTYLWSFADPSDGIVLRSEDGTATVVWNRSTGTLRVQAMLTETPFCASDCATLDVQSPFGASYAIAVVGSTACGKTFEMRRNGMPFLTASNYEWELAFPSLPSTFASIDSDPYRYQCHVRTHLISSPETCIVKCRYTICDSEFVDSIFVTFDPDPAPEVLISPASTVCSGTPVTLTVANNTVYSRIIWTDHGRQYVGSSYTTVFHNNSGSDVTELLDVVCETQCGYQFTTPVSIQVKPAVQVSLHFDASDSRLIVDGGPSGSYSYDWYYNGESLSWHYQSYVIPSGQYGTYVCVVTHLGCTTELSFDYECDDAPCSGYAIQLINNCCGEITVAVPTGTFDEVSWLPLPNMAAPSVSSDGCTATYTVPRAGNYLIRAAVSTPLCGSILSKEVQMPLVADFSIRYSCASGAPRAQLQNNSTCYPYGSTSATAITYGGTTYPVSNNCDLAAPPFSFAPGGIYSFTATAIFEGCSCSRTFDITMPKAADATFTIDPSTVCVNNPIALTPQYTGFHSYHWDLDGAASNRTVETRSYSEPSTSPYNISLTVMDGYGCTRTSSQGVRVNDNMLNGKIETNDIPVCWGTSVDLKYFTPLGPAPAFYLWDPNTPLPSYTDTKTVTDATLHTLTISDGSGCQYRMGPDGAKIIIAAPPVISGRTDICMGEEVGLHSVCGDPATMSNNAYQWYCDGTAIPAPDGTQPDLAGYRIAGTTPSSHTFRLDVTYAGTGCTASSSVTVTTHPLPVPPAIDPSPTYSCNPYAVTMQVVSASTAGTYCWSNGDNGSSITVPEGGAYNVTYISPYGCKATSDDIVIARSPESYLWTFPTGCYVICPGDTLEVHGPAKFWDGGFWKWEFFKDGNIFASGNTAYPGMDGYGVDPHLVITGAGSYAMDLGNGHCAETVGTADVSLASSCSSCSIDIKSAQFCLLPDGTVLMYLDVLNSETVPLNYNIVVDRGLIYSAHGTLLPGLNSLAPIMVPYGTVTIGDMLMGRITASKPDPKAMRCYAGFEYPVEECDKGAEPDDGGSSLTGAPFDFMLSPNPTRGGAYASFSGVGSSHVHVSVIDMKGQEVLRREVAEGEQRVFLEVSSLPGGAYMVCLVGDAGTLSCLRLIKQ